MSARPGASGGRATRRGDRRDRPRGRAPRARRRTGAATPPPRDPRSWVPTRTARRRLRRGCRAEVRRRRRARARLQPRARRPRRRAPVSPRPPGDGQPAAPALVRGEQADEHDTEQEVEPWDAATETELVRLDRAHEARLGDERFATDE